MVGEDELANLIGVRNAARLEHVQHPVALAVGFDATQQDPGVHQRRDAHFSVFLLDSGFGQAVEDRRDVTRFQKIDQTGQHRAALQIIPERQKRRQRVEDNHLRFQLFDHLMDFHQMHFQSIQRGARRFEAQQTIFAARAEVEADGAHVADNLPRTLFAGEINAALATPASGLDKVRRETGFSRARRA